MSEPRDEAAERAAREAKVKEASQLLVQVFNFAKENSAPMRRRASSAASQAMAGVGKRAEKYLPRATAVVKSAVTSARSKLSSLRDAIGLRRKDIDKAYEAAQMLQQAQNAVNDLRQNFDPEDLAKAAKMAAEQVGATPEALKDAAISNLGVLREQAIDKVTDVIVEAGKEVLNEPGAASDERLQDVLNPNNVRASVRLSVMNGKGLNIDSVLNPPDSGGVSTNPRQSTRGVPQLPPRAQSTRLDPNQIKYNDAVKKLGLDPKDEQKLLAGVPFASMEKMIKMRQELDADQIAGMIKQKAIEANLGIDFPVQKMTFSAPKPSAPAATGAGKPPVAPTRRPSGGVSAEAIAAAAKARQGGNVDAQVENARKGKLKQLTKQGSAGHMIDPKNPMIDMARRRQHIELESDSDDSDVDNGWGDDKPKKGLRKKGGGS